MKATKNLHTLRTGTKVEKIEVLTAYVNEAIVNKSQYDLALCMMGHSHPKGLYGEITEAAATCCISNKIADVFIDSLLESIEMNKEEFFALLQYSK